MLANAFDLASLHADSVRTLIAWSSTPISDDQHPDRWFAENHIGPIWRDRKPESEFSTESRYISTGDASADGIWIGGIRAAGTP